MDEITLDSNGKINLALKVLGKRPDNYHNLKTVMQEIDLKDKIRLKNIEEGIVIKSNSREIPLDQTNLVHRAYEEMKKYSGLDRGLEVYIEKNIPLAAGLAGGSSNAAKVLEGLNILWELNYSLETLEGLAKNIGADVPFCLSGGTKLALGIGNEFKAIERFDNIDILLINPRIEMSTPEVYGNLKLKTYNGEKIDRLIDGINERDLEKVSKNLENDLETAIEGQEAYIIEDIKKAMVETGALGALMSGSGSTVFGIFKNFEEASKSAELLREKFKNYYVIQSKTI